MVFQIRWTEDYTKGYYTLFDVEIWQPGWHRVNDKLLTIKEAKALGKEYEDKGYKVDLHLSEF